MTPAQEGELPTRERLIAATWRVVRDEGLRAATSRRITDEAGANLGSITYHFGSKGQLIAETSTRRMSEWMAPLGAALAADTTDGGDRTSAVIDSLLAIFVLGRADARALLEVLSASELTDVRAALGQQLRRFQTLVSEVIATQQRRGDVPGSAQPSAAAGLFTAIALGLMTQEALDAHPVPVQQIVAELLSILTNATRAP